MKFIVFLMATLASITYADDSKMPQGLPEPIDEEILIYSVAHDWEIGPDQSYKDIEKDDLEEVDAGYILGKGKVDSSSNIVKLINSSFGEPQAMALCFDPRHIIKYQSKFGTVEANICFACGKTFVTIDGWGRYFYHTKSVKDQINKLFNSSGVRLPVDG